MTIQEIEAKIAEAEAAPLNSDGSCDYWDLLPRVSYQDLPPELQAIADRLTVDKAKRFLLELYPVGALDELAEDRETFEKNILKALHTAKYVVRATKESEPIPPDDGMPLHLYGGEFMEAWETVCKLQNLSVMPHIRPASESLLEKEFYPMPTGVLSSLFASMTLKDAELDARTHTATIRRGNGTLTIEHFENLMGGLGTSAQKILDTAKAHLVNQNFYRGNDVNPTVEIPLLEYGIATNYVKDIRQMATKEEQAEENKRIATRLKNLKKSIKKDLTDIEVVSADYTEVRGKNRQDYGKIRIISSHAIRGGMIRINFDIDAARYFMNTPQTYMPRVLLLHDNKNPNSYPIGRKLAEHNNMDSNWARGTNCTLSVKSLLEAAREIPTIEELQARKARNWRDKIKKKLEAALDDNVAIGYLKKWEYRDPATGKRYNAEKANALTWAAYSRLMVDYVPIISPDQEERRMRIIQEKPALPEKGVNARNKRGKTEEQRG